MGECRSGLEWGRAEVSLSGGVQEWVRVEE